MNKDLTFYIVIFSLIIITLIPFFQVRNHEFINFDDEVYITENNYVKSGITLKNLYWAFTPAHGNWHPLTWISHMIDVELFGLNSSGHHLVNLLLHILNTVLLFLLLFNITVAIWRSSLVAVLFAIHPLHVESVAWAAERKDVLSTFFLLITILTYKHYTKQKSSFKYLLVIISFTLGLMSKSMLVTLPFLLLLLDYWPLDRLKLSSKNIFENINLFKKLLFEKLPLFLITITFCVIAFISQDKGGAVGSLEKYSLDMRISNAIISYIKYIGKLIWPNNLAFFYPYSENTISIWQVIFSATLIIAVCTFVFKKRKKYPYLIIGWLWYLGSLIPVIGLVQIGEQALADRYTYVPLIGLFIIISWGIHDISQKWLKKNIMIPIITTGALVSLLIIVTSKQVSYWRNDIALFQHAIDTTKNNYLAHYNIGVILDRQNKLSEAHKNYIEAIRIKPNYSLAHYNLGILYDKVGQSKKAMIEMQKAFKLNPSLLKGNLNL